MRLPPATRLRLSGLPNGEAVYRTNVYSFPILTIIRTKGIEFAETNHPSGKDFENVHSSSARSPEQLKGNEGWQEAADSGCSYLFRDGVPGAFARGATAAGSVNSQCP